MFKCTISRSPPQRHEEPCNLLMRRLEKWTNAIFECNVLNVVLNVLVFSILHCSAIRICYACKSPVIGKVLTGTVNSLVRESVTG